MNHQKTCKKRHQFFLKDDPQLRLRIYSNYNSLSVKFRILFFHSPVHYVAEVIAQNEGEFSSWEYLKQPKIVEIFIAQLSARATVGNPSSADIFRQIFDKIQDERFQNYVANVFLKSKDIYFVYKMKASKGDTSFLDLISATFVESRAIMNRLYSMGNQFRGGTVENAGYDDW